MRKRTATPRRRASNATSFNSIPKAMWINTTAIGQIATAITYANSIRCKHLFYGIGTNSASVIQGMLSQKPAAAFTAMTNFQAAGGKLWLMGGDVGWLDTPSVVPTAAQTILNVINANPGLFAGIHCDVEPWGAWNKDTPMSTKVSDCA